jgi:galactokinase
MATTVFPQPAKEAARNFPIAFHEDVAYESQMGAAWAPGRVNLIGEHTDYNDGYVLPIAVDRVAAFAGRMRSDEIIRLWSAHFQQYAEFSLKGLPETFEQQRSGLPSWARYILGVATELINAGVPLRGFDAVVTGDVPLGGGMSSSAALEVATAQACALFSGGKFTIGTEQATLTPMKVAEICQHAEQIASGVRCGILDQAASCLGRPGKAILLDCRSLAYRYLPFDDPDISLMVIDTGVRRELAASAYNERRQQCETAAMILRDVITEHEPNNTQAKKITALRDVSQEQFDRYKQYLPALLHKRAAYIIAEDARVLETAQLLEHGNVEGVGPLLWLGHEGLRDEYEVSCVELDTLVQIAQEVPGVLGARMLGGGFGGCTINLVRNRSVDLLSQAVEKYYPLRTGRQATIDICRAAGGPGYGWMSE